MRLRYYTMVRGTHPVADYIEGLARADQAVIAVALAEVAARGFEARGVTFRQIEGKLWEMRVGPHRVFMYYSARRRWSCSTPTGNRLKRRQPGIWRSRGAGCWRS